MDRLCFTILWILVVAAPWQRFFTCLAAPLPQINSATTSLFSLGAEGQCPPLIVCSPGMRALLLPDMVIENCLFRLCLLLDMPENPVSKLSLSTCPTTSTNCSQANVAVSWTNPTSCPRVDCAAACPTLVTCLPTEQLVTWTDPTTGCLTGMCEVYWTISLSTSMSRSTTFSSPKPPPTAKADTTIYSTTHITPVTPTSQPTFSASPAYFSVGQETTSSSTSTTRMASIRTTIVTASNSYASTTPVPKATTDLPTPLVQTKSPSETTFSQAATTPVRPTVPVSTTYATELAEAKSSSTISTLSTLPTSSSTISTLSTLPTSSSTISTLSTLPTSSSTISPLSTLPTSSSSVVTSKEIPTTVTTSSIVTNSTSATTATSVGFNQTPLMMTTESSTQTVVATSIAQQRSSTMTHTTLTSQLASTTAPTPHIQSISPEFATLKPEETRSTASLEINTTRQATGSAVASTNFGPTVAATTVLPTQVTRLTTQPVA